MADRPSSYSHFRLNFEQQQKRAKDLLRAARAGEPAARSRFKSVPRLAEAQYLIAKELRFANWTALKRHILAMTLEREAMEVQPRRSKGDSSPPDLDAGQRTLHIRCGSDIKRSLRVAGFGGEFYEHSYPYLAGPVKDGGPGCLEERARFLVGGYGKDLNLDYDSVIEGLRRDEQRLLDSSDFERVVIWSEPDCHDQLVLVRVLGHYAMHRRPTLIELINVGEFPGAERFIGLGQLPPEALRILWRTRQAIGERELDLGLQSWRTLASSDPRALAAIMRGGTPALRLLRPALHRHLRELPSSVNGLSLTEEMALTLLASEPLTLNELFTRLNYAVDPLPGQGDLQVRDRLLSMETARELVFTRSPHRDRYGRENAPWTDRLAITDLGRAVLRGEVDFRSLEPEPRWVGGVEIAAGQPDWRWNERIRDAERR